MNKIITIDGPSASGKGTLAILLAERLNWKILDSGALYRAFAYFSISENDQRLIEQNLRKISFNIADNSIQVLFENEDISGHLRTEETAIQASKISSLPSTREILLPIQRFFSETSNLIADGRDMGSVVFPNANLKFFLDAAPEVRAKRRYLELQKRGQEVNIDSFGDHRIAMSFLIAGLRFDSEVHVNDCKNIDTSFPSFFEIFSSLGAEIKTV